MAQIGVAPIPNTPAGAKAAFEKDLDRVLKGKTLEELGWERSDSLTLFVPLTAVRENGDEDSYLLRLQFGYYPEWPPSAKFVNPKTKTYSPEDDRSWLPKIEGTNELGIHADYNNKGQLICCSLTLEFYLVGHGVEARHLWDHNLYNFAGTINTIKRYLRPPYYKGRQS